MLGIFVQLVLSWLILWLVEKKNLSVLGFTPSATRLKNLLLFFAFAALCCLVEIALRMQFFKERYQLNPLFNLRLLWEGFRWNLVSVLYEELIFRGALLYILIKRWGRTRGILVSSIAFGIYHWFSYNLFGNTPAMIYVFIITALMGWVLAYSYAGSRSLYIAIGFHLAWNFVNGFVFSKGSIGNGVFIPAKEQPVVNVSYFTYYTITILPILGAIVGSYLLIRKGREHWPQQDPW